ncbi:hypothetical protein DPMN_146698 [Dreissena polymorpha]|uniref:Uncharacterized protein n=1 Tax=Dreissena polymorpha TaxID=45954 RepID=A0A9D4F716_DREPO|nr:hypothetical protein DPMN_146698 [Dreissena polymorpha]
MDSLIVQETRSQVKGILKGNKLLLSQKPTASSFIGDGPGQDHFRVAGRGPAPTRHAGDLDECMFECKL